MRSKNSESVQPRTFEKIDSQFQVLNEYAELVCLRANPDFKAFNERGIEATLSAPQTIIDSQVKQLSFQTRLETQLGSGKAEKGQDTRQLVFRLLNQFGWSLETSLLPNLEDEDVVEVYNKDHIQIFRTINYFKFTSYSLAELLFKPWYELFDHGDKLKVVREVGSSIMNGSRGPLFEGEIGEYEAKEVQSELGLKVKLNTKLILPFFDRGSSVPQGALVVTGISFVGG